MSNSKDRQRQRAMEAHYRKMNAINNASNPGQYTPQIVDTPIGKVHTGNLGKALFAFFVLASLAVIVVMANNASEERVEQRQQLEQRQQ